MIGAVVLAAGAGRRLGTVCKATLPIDGATFLEAVTRAGCAAGVDEWLVVVGPPHQEESCAEAARLGLPVVENPTPERGMGSSVACGFAAAGARFAGEAALLWPVDHPRVSASTIGALCALADVDGIVVPTFRGRGGHPPLVGRTVWPELAAADEAGEGARGVFRRQPGRVRRVPFDDPGVVADVDTRDALP